jgi:hypothetical protein
MYYVMSHTWASTACCVQPAHLQTSLRLSVTDHWWLDTWRGLYAWYTIAQGRCVAVQHPCNQHNQHKCGSCCYTEQQSFRLQSWNAWFLKKCGIWKKGRKQIRVLSLTYSMETGTAGKAQLLCDYYWDATREFALVCQACLQVPEQLMLCISIA